MIDTIIKGTGNSRTLRTVPNALTMYPDHVSMLQAMINGTFPIDLGGLQMVGLDQKGTDLNKANLLKDATAVLLGLGMDAVIDDALKELSKRTQIERGSYNGTGAAFGSGNPKTINFSFSPQLVFIASYNEATWAMFRPVGYARFTTTGKSVVVSWGEKSMSFYTGGTQLNENGVTYYYIGMG